MNVVGGADGTYVPVRLVDVSKNGGVTGYDIDGGNGVDGGPTGEYCGGGTNGGSSVGKNCNGCVDGGPYLGPYNDGPDAKEGGTPYSGRYVVRTVGVSSLSGIIGHLEDGRTLSSSQPRP